MSKKMSVREKAAMVKSHGASETIDSESSSMQLSHAVDTKTLMAYPSIARKSVSSIAMGLSMTGQGAQIAELQHQVAASTAVSDELRLKVEVAQARAAEFDGASVERKIDPNLIVASVWANRSEQSFLSKDFSELKKDIESQGGNVQAIKVRPHKDTAGRFEIVFGHRRHRACLELGIKVLAVVEDLSETELFCQMDRENRARKDLSPIEQGRMYAQALDNGLFPSARKLSEFIGADLSNMGKALTLARLPAPVLDAFPSVFDLQYRWGKVLDEILKKEPELLLSRANDAKTVLQNATSKEVFQYLTEGGGTVPPPTPLPKTLRGKGGQTGTFAIDPAKRSVTIQLSNFDPTRASEIEKLIAGLIS